LYSIFMEFGILMKLVRLIKMCLTEIHRKACVGKYLSYIFPIQKLLKHRDVLRQLHSNVALEYTVRNV
jgi:hypothetical protein